jgi:predicted kinase
VPIDFTALSERERQLVEQVAQQRGITYEEAAEMLAKEGLESRVRRRTGRAPAKVYDMNRGRK